MKIAIACDHSAVEFKDQLINNLKTQGYNTLDFGSYTNKSCDYPDYAQSVTQAIISNEAYRGILICNNGIGMSMAANRISGIRAALVYSEITAKMTRQHHDSNVLCLGRKQFHKAELIRFIDIWLHTSFDGGRHQRRIDKFQ